MLRKLALTFALAVSSFTSPALAGVHEDHQQLIYALEERGIEVQYNTRVCSKTDLYGYYAAMQRYLVICQTNRSLPHLQVGWSTEDYDTLRHEAVHVIQDCLSGKIADGNSVLLFNDPVKLKELLSQTLNQEQIQTIVREYRANNVSDDQIERELEAFAISSIEDAKLVTKGIKELCPAK